MAVFNPDWWVEPCTENLFLLQAKEYAETLENAVWTNQFDNRANRLAHFQTTGPEIWEQTGKGHFYDQSGWRDGYISEPAFYYALASLLSSHL